MGKDLAIPSHVKGVILYNDCQPAQKLLSKAVGAGRTKHIDVRYHFIREKVHNGDIEIRYLPTTEMVADICTKSLPTQKHKCCVAGLGLY